MTERTVEAKDCGEEQTHQALAETGRISACALHGAVFHPKVEGFDHFEKKCRVEGDFGPQV